MLSKLLMQPLSWLIIAPTELMMDFDSSWPGCRLKSSSLLVMMLMLPDIISKFCAIAVTSLSFLDFLDVRPLVVCPFLLEDVRFDFDFVEIIDRSRGGSSDPVCVETLIVSTLDCDPISSLRRTLKRDSSDDALYRLSTRRAILSLFVMPTGINFAN